MISKTYEELLAENEALKRQVDYYLKLIDNQSKVSRRDWELQQDYLPYEESDRD